jgi:RNA polymerase sigma-70 factor (ECF subfamily)
MASSILYAKFTGFAFELPAVAGCRELLKATYQEHQNRIYNLAFYLTDNELTAEKVSAQVFSRVFPVNMTPSAEALDKALVEILREMMSIGNLSLDVPASTEPANARRNVKRAILERAVMEIPATERLIFLMHDVEGYDHSRIARTLGISTDESCNGLHQARLALRRAVAQVQF